MNHPPNAFALAARLQQQGRVAEAVAAYREALLRHPRAADAWYNLGYLLRSSGDYEAALDAYARALHHGVSAAEEVHLNRAVIYTDHLRRDQDAERELQAALAIAPQFVPALLNLGNLHEERGSREQALACYDRILASEASAGDAHGDLRLEAMARSASLRPPTGIDDAGLQRLREAAYGAVEHGQVVRANLLFALGRAYDALGADDEAFAAFAKANRCLLRQTGRVYRPQRTVALVDALVQTFGAATQAAEAQSPPMQAQPLFICGMFRSGSTLIEQVLGAHPAVTAGGELDYLLRLASGPLAPFPASMAQPDPDRDRELAKGYHEHLLKLYPEGAAGAFITDKRPDNFLLIGLILRLFPRAKIVHSVRNPLDVGLSIYMQNLNHHVAAYANDLGDIGHYIGQYRRLMQHWKSLYPGHIHDFDYDRFVRNPDPELERLFGFLGLDWSEQCRDFHQLGNTVKTASYWQVRQPLYGSASGRWQRYQQHLRPLREALSAAGVDIGIGGG